MPYIERKDGEIIGAYAMLQSGYAEEFVADDNAELLAFLSPLPTLNTIKTSTARGIDADAEAARLRYITGGSGQAMTYQQKAAEAAAALAATDPDPANYPLIVAEIGITAPTLLEVAAVIDGAYQQWRVVGAAIEALRLGGKAAVAAATTVEDAQAAADITWP
ncbi:hypothetical protein [Agrobacterium deltaense]|uniref:hypothetical protein n=1 Tax=Agrobacterium deltaense TaxID=1183412 RepID=UPI001C6E86F0|nr:hypothetical protein [Agrobacterium deltaense]MBW9072405.1 hypothetical protein [Agrobacterium deltaense]